MKKINQTFTTVMSCTVKLKIFRIKEGSDDIKVGILIFLEISEKVFIFTTLYKEFTNCKQGLEKELIFNNIICNVEITKT